MPTHPNAPIRYPIDSRASQFTIQAFAEGLAGIADHRPRFAVSDFSGEISLAPNLGSPSLQLTIRTNSLTVMDEVSSRDREAIERVMFQEVLEASRFPQIAYQSTRVTMNLVSEGRYQVQVDGNLSLHGVENPHSLSAQLHLADGSLRAYGDFRLAQTNYGIKIASVAGGLLSIKDELKCVFYIVARTGR